MADTRTAGPADRGLVTETIAVLGAGGTMGFPIARNIACAGLRFVDVPVLGTRQPAGKLTNATKPAKPTKAIKAIKRFNQASRPTGHQPPRRAKYPKATG